jgi:hypothetical protein
MLKIIGEMAIFAEHSVGKRSTNRNKGKGGFAIL